MSSRLLYDFTKLFAPGVYFCMFGFRALDVTLMCIDVFFSNFFSKLIWKSVSMDLTQCTPLSYSILQ